MSAEGAEERKGSAMTGTLLDTVMNLMVFFFIALLLWAYVKE
jgi:hypothetical protein